jgi:hypothetical protein
VVGSGDWMAPRRPLAKLGAAFFSFLVDRDRQRAALKLSTFALFGRRSNAWWSSRNQRESSPDRKASR